MEFFFYYSRAHWVYNCAPEKYFNTPPLTQKKYHGLGSFLSQPDPIGVAT